MSKLQANLVLLLAAALWGTGNVAQKLVLAHLDPFSAVGLRCLIASLLILPFAGAPGRTRVGPARWKSLARIAAYFTLGLLLQQLAFAGTSVTNAGFLVNTESVIVPVLAWVMLRERPGRTLVVAATVTLGGIALLSGGLVRGFSSGDLLALAAALAFALWTVELSRHLRNFGDAAFVTGFQFLLAAAATLPLGATVGNLSLASALSAGPELLLLGVFSTALAFGLQTSALRFTTSSHAAVIASAESVFGAFGAVMLLGERISAVEGMGCGMVLAAVVLLALAPLPRLPADKDGTPPLGAKQPVRALPIQQSPGATRVGRSRAGNAASEMLMMRERVRAGQSCGGAREAARVPQARSRRPRTGEAGGRSSPPVSPRPRR